MHHADADQTSPIRKLYPGLNEDQLKEIEDLLHDYAALVWRVCERLEREKSSAFDAGADHS